MRRRNMKELLLILITLSLAACATSSGFNRSYLRDSMNSISRRLPTTLFRKHWMPKLSCRNLLSWQFILSWVHGAAIGMTAIQKCLRHWSVALKSSVLLQ